MKNLIRFTAVFSCLCFISATYAQERVGINTTGFNLTHQLTITSADSNVLRLIGPGTPGETFYGQNARLTFGDLGGRVYLEEDSDDKLNIFGLSRTSIMGGYVGIGTKTPERKLDVAGAARFNGNSTVMGNFDITGRLGIGIPNPSWDLDIVGAGTDEGSVLQLSNSDKSQYVRIFGGRENDPNPFISWQSGSTFHFYSANNDFSSIVERMRIDTLGNVGIGSIAPAKNLHVYDTDDPTVLIQSNGISEPSGRLSLRQSNFTGFDIFYDGLNDYLIFEGFNGGNSTGQHMTMNFNTGNVGIGTDFNASTNNAAGYRLSVNGKIAATEVRVQPTAQWPDYVFAPGYDLMSLSELEKSIRQQSHLPGIPSATEIQENGLELGEMQRKMMEKIEELTLYILDLNHDVSVLNHEVEELKKENAEQAARIRKLKSE